MDILSKNQNYRLWQNGDFGNKLRAWRTLEDFQKSGFSGNVSLRVLLNNSGTRKCAYSATSKIETVVQTWIDSGISRDAIMINETAPDTEILQGEYRNDIYMLDGVGVWDHFFYSRMRAKMRTALSLAPENAYGLQARLLIQQAMTPSSYEDWNLLISRYPSHVFEVSIYENCLGDTPGRNALVWEIRRY